MNSAACSATMLPWRFRSLDDFAEPMKFGGDRRVMSFGKLRMAVDAAMTILLPCLMAYSLIGELFHEIAGTAMLGLFIAHHILNRVWIKHLFRGKYDCRRAFGTVVNLLLCVIMVCLPLSGILMSKHLFAFLPTEGFASAARTVHLLCSYWGFVLMSVHLGLHLDAMLKRRPAWLSIAAGAAALYGAYAFVKRGLPRYLFLRSRFVFFDYGEPRVLFFADYLAMMALFAILGWSAARGLRKIGKNR